MRDDYDDEFEGEDEGGSLVPLVLACFAAWCLVVVVTWALR